MTDEEFKDEMIECMTLELLLLRYLYYVKDTPVASDNTYDIMEKEAKKFGIEIFMDKTGMVGYDESNPYHERIVGFLGDRTPDQYEIQAWCWRRLYPEHWEHYSY